ncbi:hypothetical protein AD45P3_00265 [Alteromonas phage vB_AmaP_AD45-P3]|nr:hypothetical protein AD45P3_00265 [Alteromonas phage vB_AmaP_AD45-P3]
MHFGDFKQAIQQQFKTMNPEAMFVVDVTKEQLWDTYLASFPEGSNPIYRERTEHDCNCCKQFIRNIGALVSVVDDKVVSIWDIDIDGAYKVVANAMKELILSAPIKQIYLNDSAKVGTDHNFEDQGDKVRQWDHFFLEIPSSMTMRKDRIATRVGQVNTNFSTTTRALTSLSMSACATVRDLIMQNSLYRGEEHLDKVNAFMNTLREYRSLETDEKRTLFCWVHAKQNGIASTFRNSVIGTLIDDISEGFDLEDAVASFESKVAPHNYKRSKALITPAMVKKANETIQELGIESALHRRMAKLSDITINNVLFADDSVKESMGVLDVLNSQVKNKTPKEFKNVEEVSVEKFIKDILPNATSMDLFLENGHLPNFVNLITPADADAPNILKWDNNFSWSYVSGTTDSVKERVKKAGGDVSGDLRLSLAWHNGDDLDLSLRLPSGRTVYYGNSRDSVTGANLDVDMNAGTVDDEVNPVENIVIPRAANMPKGIYTAVVHNFTSRDSKNPGYEVEFEFLGKIMTFTQEHPVRQNQKDVVVEFEYNGTDVRVLSSLPSTTRSKEQWGVSTQNFVPVDSVMLSPNYWDDQKVGNKHYFFMLKECANPNPVRGLYNEFLSNELQEHRKVFEVLGANLQAESTPSQLAGIGFSSTLRNSVICRVKGAFNRTIKIKF